MNPQDHFMTTKHIGRNLGVALVLLLAPGAWAAPAASDPGNLRWEEVPAVVQKAIKETAKGASVRQLSRTPEIYTARFDTKGQKSEVRVSESGKVLRSRSKQEAEALFEEEQRLAQAGQLNTVALEDVAAGARAVIAERAKGTKLDQIVRAPATFTATFDRNGASEVIRIAADGKVLAGIQP